MWHQPKQIVRNRDMYVNSCDRSCPLCTTRVRRRAPPACARRRAPALAWDAPGVYRKRPVPGFIETGHTPCSRIGSAKIAPLRGKGEKKEALKELSQPQKSSRCGEQEREGEGEATPHAIKSPSCGPVETTASAKAPHPPLNSAPHEGRCQKRRAASHLRLLSKSAPCGALGIS